MTDFEHIDYEDEDEFEKSKSQIKREMEALQTLGRKLTELKPSQLKKVPISEDLNHAIKESYNIRQREAKRRHLQFIGKLMRSEDAEAIQYAIDQFDSSSERFAQELHKMESWRDQLIAGGNEVLSNFISENPAADVQHLRSLIRNAKKDLDHGKNTGAGKKLFQYIRTLLMDSD
jgi:ribosome-associated protein